jgi:hypothetical protein
VVEVPLGVGVEVPLEPPLQVEVDFQVGVDSDSLLGGIAVVIRTMRLNSVLIAVEITIPHNSEET